MRDKADFLRDCFSATIVADRYGLTAPYLLNLNYRKDEKPSNALKLVRTGLEPHLGNRPFIAAGVRIIGNRHVHDHGHDLAFLGHDAATYLDAIRRDRNAIKARSLEIEAAYDLPGAIWYRAGPENLERAGAKLYLSEVVKKEGLREIFQGFPTLAEYRCLPWPAWVPQEERRRFTSVTFPTIPSVITPSTPANANVAGQLTAISPTTALIDRQRRIDPTAVDARQCSAGAGDLANIPDAFDPETGEIIPDNDNASIVIHAGLFGNEVIECRVIDGFIHGIGHAAILMAAKRTLVATGF
jgi:hypothetical protein